MCQQKKWKKERFGTSWLVGDTLNVGIGQGFSLATPLQLAVMTARLASGKKLTPNLIRTPNRDPDEPKDLPLRKSTLASIRKGMFDVLNDKEGTAYKSRSTNENFLIAGKTGTSQVRRITKEEREEGVIKNEDLPWEMRDHALFTCFAPYKNPKYALSVVVEHGGSGSKVAAPIARDIMLFQLYGGIPPVTAYPDKQQIEVRNKLSDIAKKINLRTNVTSDI
ncbi:penicillin-binding transpeptidase domain-containing protein [Paracoccaceae bacterium]|nr:penicillin-binding transpeptidase domain-containing protein [Paracoccaceae bacterium]